MMSSEIAFTLFYFLLSVCIVCPTSEFVSAGVTIQQLFSSYLGREEEKFVTFHIKRSIITLLVFSLLPLGYIVLLFLLGYVEEVYLLFYDTSLLWNVFSTTSIVLPLLALYQIKNWTDNNYEKHPIAINLSKYCNNDMHWSRVASDIDVEFRRVDKFLTKSNTVTTVIATENWLLKVTPFTMNVAHQSDATLTVKEAANYNISSEGGSQTQYLNIEVNPNRTNVEPFKIRINSVDFRDLQARIGRDITVMPNVKFHKTVIEQFVEVFKETVKRNPRYQNNEDLEQCIGCLQANHSVKLSKQCEDDISVLHCVTCYCKPMWCLDCMAKWFASRQDPEQQNGWLSSKCTCPMCRARFCVLDVCLLSNVVIDE